MLCDTDKSHPKSALSFFLLPLSPSFDTIYTQHTQTHTYYMYMHTNPTYAARHNPSLRSEENKVSGCKEVKCIIIHEHVPTTVSYVSMHGR